MSAIRSPRRLRGGFSLVELAIVILIMSLIAGSAMTIGVSRMESAAFTDNDARMGRVEEGVAAYVSKNGFLPCPADPALGLTAAGYGVSNCAATCTCTSGCSCPSPPCWANHICRGAVPVVTLNISDELAFDGWGRRFTYAVDQRFTNLGHAQTGALGGRVFCAFDPRDADPATVTVDETGRQNFCASNPTDADPAIAINNAAVASNPAASGLWVADLNGTLRTDDAVMVLVSHGANGRCARDRNGGAANVCAVDASTPQENIQEQENADADRAFQQSAVRSGQFDDVVRYLLKWQMVQRVGGIVDTRLCEKAARIALCGIWNPVTGAGSGMLTGPVGCLNETTGAQHVGCTSIQTELARAVTSLCFADLSYVCN